MNRFIGVQSNVRKLTGSVPFIQGWKLSGVSAWDQSGLISKSLAHMSASRENRAYWRLFSFATRTTQKVTQSHNGRGKKSFCTLVADLYPNLYVSVARCKIFFTSNKYLYLLKMLIISILLISSQTSSCLFFLWRLNIPVKPDTCLKWSKKMTEGVVYKTMHNISHVVLCTVSYYNCSTFGDHG